MYYSFASIVVAAVVLFAVQTGAQIIYNIFFSKLRDIPGPLIAKITPKWLVLVDIAGNRTSTLHRLHQRYGTSVRVAPNEVSFSNVESVKEIYGQQTASMKAPAYEEMSTPPLGIFSLTDKSQHAERRRLLSHVFSQSNILESEPLIMQSVSILVRKIQEGIMKPLDMLLLFRLYSFDVVGELFLGQSFGGLEASKAPQFLHDMDSHFILCAIKTSFPWLYAILARLPVASLRNFFQSRERMKKYGRDAFNDYLSQYGRDSGRRDLLTKLLVTKPETGDAVLTDMEITQEISNLVFAGTDTTSTTLTYMFWELARNPSWQAKIREELRTKVSDNGHDGLPSYRELQDLPVLDAIINEALRLHPAAPASLQRETPAGGRILDGHFVPEKTIVSMQCYTTQRSPDAFANPNSFLPERWLEPAKESSTANELFMPFSKGTRACLGKGLALVEMKLATAALLKLFEVGLAPGTTEESMSMTDHFLVIPKGGKCELVFQPV